MRVEFVIDELVLVGFDPRERHRIADAIQDRLAALVTCADVVPLQARATGMSVVRAGDFTVARSASVWSPLSVADGASRSIVAALRSHGAPSAGTPEPKGVPS
jgi:hypothetical protein